MEFASDNSSGATPEVMEALNAANTGYAPSYGTDPLMAEATDLIRGIFDAPEAEMLGLVARVVEKGALDAAVEAEVAPYLSCAPLAVAGAKALARALGPRIDEAVIEDSIRRLADAWEGPEAMPGIRAFLDKRPPPWG